MELRFKPAYHQTDTGSSWSSNPSSSGRTTTAFSGGMSAACAKRTIISNERGMRDRNTHTVNDSIVEKHRKCEVRREQKGRKQARVNSDEEKREESERVSIWDGQRMMSIVA